MNEEQAKNQVIQLALAKQETLREMLDLAAQSKDLLRPLKVPNTEDREELANIEAKQMSLYGELIEQFDDKISELVDLYPTLSEYVNDKPGENDIISKVKKFYEGESFKERMEKQGFEVGTHELNDSEIKNKSGELWSIRARARHNSHMRELIKKLGAQIADNLDLNDSEDHGLYENLTEDIHNTQNNDIQYIRSLWKPSFKNHTVEEYCKQLDILNPDENHTVPKDMSNLDWIKQEHENVTVSELYPAHFWSILDNYEPGEEDRVIYTPHEPKISPQGHVAYGIGNNIQSFEEFKAEYELKAKLKNLEKEE